MGCWNKTCGLTQLPILSGERVIMFPLIEVTTDASRCYSNWNWEYLPVPFYGTYDNYGFMEFDDGQEYKLELLQNYYKDRLVRIEPYDEGAAREEENRKRAEDAGNEYTEKEYDCSYIRYPALTDTPFVNNETMANQMHGDVFGIKDWYKKDNVSKLSHIMIREDAFRKVASGIHISDDDKTSSQPLDYILEVIQAYKDYVENTLDALSKAMENPDISEEEKKLLRMELSFKALMSEGTLTSFTKEELPKLRNARGFTVGYDWYALDRNILRNTFDARSGGSSEGYETNGVMGAVKFKLPASDLVDCYALTVMFSRLRKSFSPQGGEGSQDGTSVFHDLFGVAFMEAAYTVANPEDEEFDDEDDEVVEDTTDRELNKYEIYHQKVKAAGKEYKEALTALKLAAEKIRQISYEY